MSISLKANAAGTQGELQLNGNPVLKFNPGNIEFPDGSTQASAAYTKAQSDALFAPKTDPRVWVNYLVPTQRAFGVTFTNNTGRTIQVAFGISSAAATSLVRATVSGVLLGGVSAKLNEFVGQQTFDVPPGAQYAVNGAGGSPTLDSWAELR